MECGDRRERFRAIVEGERCIRPASVYDGICARVAEEVGFELMLLAGSVASFSVLAAPDIGLLTLSEFAEQAYRINRAGRLPLLVDADHGYGNALNVRRTVEELETAGISALTIEDTLLPPPFASNGNASLIPIAEGVGKIRAACGARHDPKLVVVGRTSANAIVGLEEAIARLRAFESAGADMLFPTDVKTRAELDAITSAVERPLVLASVPDELNDLDYLAARNVRVSMQGHHPFWASVNGIYEALKSLHAGVSPRDLRNIAPPDLQALLLRKSDYSAWQKEYLT